VEPILECCFPIDQPKHNHLVASDQNLKEFLLRVVLLDEPYQIDRRNRVAWDKRRAPLEVIQSKPKPGCYQSLDDPNDSETIKVATEPKLNCQSW
jgi:hypothetical protein